MQKFLIGNIRLSLFTKGKKFSVTSLLKFSTSKMLLITAVFLLNWNICYSQAIPDTTISTSAPYTKILISISPTFLWANLRIVQTLNNNWGIALTGRTPWTDSVKGYGFDLEARRYFLTKEVEGWYGAGMISYGDFHYLDTIANPLSVGIMIGRDVDIGEPFLMSFGLGIDYFIHYDPFHAYNEGSSGTYADYVYAMNGRVMPYPDPSKERWSLSLRIDIGFYWVWQ